MDSTEHLNIFSNKKKELLISFISHSAGMDGAERSLLDLIAGLKSRGVLCHVVIPGQGPMEDELKKMEVPYDVLTYRFWTMGKNEEKEKVEDEINIQTIALATLLETINPDIIYTNTSVINVGALAAKILGKPHVWHIREFGELDHNMKFTLPIKERSKFVYENSERVIYNSKAVEEYYAGDKEKGAVIYNNVSVPTGGLVNTVPIFKNKKSYKLAVIGTVHAGKNQEDVILAVKDLINSGINAELIIVGGIEGSYGEKLNKIISDNKLNDKIRLLGYVLKPYSLLCEVDALVVCSKSEAFGRVVVEGMLAKKPIIATRSGGIPEIITDGVNGLLYTPGKYEELAEKLKFLFDNKDKADLYAKNGYNFAIEHFNDDKYSGKITKIFNTLGNFVTSGFNSLYTKIWKVQSDNIKKLDSEIFGLIKSVQKKDQEVSILNQKIVVDNETYKKETESLSTQINNIEQAQFTLEGEKKSLNEQIAQQQNKFFEEQKFTRLEFAERITQQQNRFFEEQKITESKFVEQIAQENQRSFEEQKIIRVEFAEQIAKQSEVFLDQYKIVQSELVSMVGKLNQQNILLRQKEEEKKQLIEQHEKVLLVKNEEEKHLIERNKNELNVKDSVISALQEKDKQQTSHIQLKEQEIIVLQNQISGLSTAISNKDIEIAFMQSSKFWKLRNEYIRSKWALLNPLKFTKKYLIKSMPKYSQIKWAVFHPYAFIKKSILIRKRRLQSNIYQKIVEKKASVVLPLKTVYYVSNVEKGGASKYINDLIDTFGSIHLNFVQIKNRGDLNLYKGSFTKNDVFIFQYFFITDLTFEDVASVKKEYGMKLVIPTHDFYFLGKSNIDLYQFNISVHSNYLVNPSFRPQILKLLQLADVIIYPSHFVKNIFDSVFIFKNAQLSRHIDNKIIEYTKIPKVEKNINIGVINDIHIHKGASYYPELFRVKKYKGHNVVYHIFGHVELKSPNVVFHGVYDENQIFSLLQKNNIHGLAFLNECAETYSYSLTKGINSGLPILYSNTGAYIERLQNNKKYFPVNNIKKIELEMQKMLNLIVNNHCTTSKNVIISTEKDIPDLYRNIFSIDYDYILNDKYQKNKKLYDDLFKFIEPYAIYLPQFHALEENKKTFYDGYHDMINLQQAKLADQSIETPLKNYLGYYNLKNDSGIIEKQVLLAKSNGIKGFAIYYYWFSQNTVTGNNMLMKDVVDKFFQKSLKDFDVFFIYANESWSGNPAFNQHSNDYIITNKYSNEEITKNFENLLRYFKHVNYKKINNKPVLFIHHPWEMTLKEFELFYALGNEMVKKNGFAGLELFVNGMYGNYDGYKNYSHHADYKNTSDFTSIGDGVRYIDYQKYVDKHVFSMPFRSSNIQTVFYNFNNSVRYFNHKNKKILVTKTKNNNIEYFKKFLVSQFDTYHSSNKVGKILLLNSWNEWGEQMAIEPSSEFGFKLLDAFNEVVIKFTDKTTNKIQLFRQLLPLVNSNSRLPLIFSGQLGEKEICVVLHLYYTDMWNEIKEKLKNIPYSYSLIISLIKGHYTQEDIEEIFKFNPKTKILIFENKGMDILPFLKSLKYVPKTTKYLLKMHTKRSLQNPAYGSAWFVDLVNHMLEDEHLVDMILDNLAHTDIGMIGGSTLSGFEYQGLLHSTEFYEAKIELIYDYYKTHHSDYKWVAGSMFWVRFDLINKFDDKFIDFFEKNQPSGYSMDATIAHGLERYFCKLVYDAGKTISLNPVIISKKDKIND